MIPLKSKMGPGVDAMRVHLSVIKGQMWNINYLEDRRSTPRFWLKSKVQKYMFTWRFLVFFNFIFWLLFRFFQIDLGETQIEVIWMKKIGMMILKQREINVKVVWFPHQLILLFWHSWCNFSCSEIILINYKRWTLFRHTIKHSSNASG